MHKRLLKGDKNIELARARNRVEQTLLRGQLGHFGKLAKQVERDLSHIRECKLSLMNGLIKQNQFPEPRKSNRGEKIELHVKIPTESNTEEKCSPKETVEDDRSKDDPNKLGEDDGVEKEMSALDEDDRSSSLEVLVPKCHNPEIPKVAVNYTRFDRRRSDVATLGHVPTPFLPRITTRSHSSPNVTENGTRGLSLPQLDAHKTKDSTAPLVVIGRKGSLEETLGPKTHQELVEEACLKSKFRLFGQSAIGAAVLVHTRRFSVPAANSVKVPTIIGKETKPVKSESEKPFSRAENLPNRSRRFSVPATNSVKVPTIIGKETEPVKSESEEPFSGAENLPNLTRRVSVSFNSGSHASKQRRGCEADSFIESRAVQSDDKLVKMRQEEVEHFNRIAWGLKSRNGARGRRYSEPAVFRK